MLVVIANDLPPAVRGRMKLWFVEPRPGVFVSGVKDAVAKRVVDYLMTCCDSKSGLLIFSQSRTAPWYEIYSRGQPHREIVRLSGMSLIRDREVASSPP